MPSLHFSFECETRKIKSQYAGGILLPPVQTLVATFIFAHSRAKMQTSLATRTIKAERAFALSAFIFENKRNPQPHKLLSTTR